jgi:hypothetical protein
MNATSSTRHLTLSDRRTNGLAALGPLLVGAVLAIAHLATVGRYGVFRDEFYYLACGRHLAWGYVDHPPLVAALARVSILLGDSMLAIRILPIAVGLLTLWAADAVARRVGAGAFGRLVTILCIAVAPHFLFVFHVLSMNGPEVLLWTLAAYSLVVALEGEHRTAWLAFGVICGFGLLNKHSMLVFGLGVWVGLLATRARRALLTPWPWMAALIAGAMFAPHLLWQIQHGWPTAEFIANAKREKIVALSPLAFIAALTDMLNPFTAPVWILGLLALLAIRGRPVLRVLGCCAVVVVVVFLTQRSKAYYATPVFPSLFAAGGWAIERWTARFSRARLVIPVVLVVAGLASAPFALPVLDPDQFVAYSKRLGMTPRAGERHETGPLPQHFADMFGWEQLARTVSHVYLDLPEPERRTARVFAQNYGEAGALEHYASRYPLPRVISPHNNYWYWGPGPDGGTIIVVGGRREELLDALDQVDEVARTSCDYCMPYERNLPVFVGHGWKVSLNAIWPREKRFI